MRCGKVWLADCLDLQQPPNGTADSVGQDGGDEVDDEQNDHADAGGQVEEDNPVFDWILQGERRSDANNDDDDDDDGEPVVVGCGAVPHHFLSRGVCLGAGALQDRAGRCMNQKAVLGVLNTPQVFSDIPHHPHHQTPASTQIKMRKLRL